MTKKIMMFILVAGLLTACGSKNEEMIQTEEVAAESVAFREDIDENQAIIDEVLEESEIEDKNEIEAK